MGADEVVDAEDVDVRFVSVVYKEEEEEYGGSVELVDILDAGVDCLLCLIGGVCSWRVECGMM